LEKATYGFPRAQKSVGNDLSTGRRHSESDGLVLGGVITKSTSVDILEDLVESELSESLSGVSDEGWGPSLKQARLGKKGCYLQG